MSRFIEARPYPWPYDGNLRPDNTALVIIDMQTDFCGIGGYVDKMGYDLSMTRAPIEPIRNVLTLMREQGFTIIHTREGHRPDLSDLPANKRWRSRRAGTNGVGIGDDGPCGKILVRGEPGWEIIDELKPIEGEIVIDKPGKGAFYATRLDEELARRGITHLVFAGVTTEVCVQTSIREANDRGYECVLIEDATASYIPSFKTATIEMIRSQGGIVGWTATLADLVEN
jgi:nicotinamidase-related amidase